MREIVADVKQVGCCGLYCGACGAYLKEKCAGCHESKKRDWCSIKACCAQKGFWTCAECDQHEDPCECDKAQCLISKIIGFFTKSDRPACVRQIRETVLKAYATKMADLKLQAIPKSNR